jgi:ApaG protein
MSAQHLIIVVPEARFEAEQSDPEENRYVFSYRIRITNRGTEPAQLISRHWVITDADGKVQEVRGQGVIGEQPVVQPGESFEYSSGSILETPFGTMRGSYQMQAADGARFNADIPEFILSGPRMLH